MQTFWLHTGPNRSDESSLATDGSESDKPATDYSGSFNFTMPTPAVADEKEHSQAILESLSMKQQRLVIWCVEILSRMLKQVVAHQAAKPAEEQSVIDQIGRAHV